MIIAKTVKEAMDRAHSHRRPPRGNGEACRETGASLVPVTSLSLSLSLSLFPLEGRRTGPFFPLPPDRAPKAEAVAGAEGLRGEIRPIYHYKPDRVRAHIFLCILGLLIHKIIEKITSETAETVLKQLKHIHLTELKTPETSRKKLTQLNSRQEEIFERLDIAAPKELKVQEDLW